jgi:hypothetical protein
MVDKLRVHQTYGYWDRCHFKSHIYLNFTSYTKLMDEVEVILRLTAGQSVILTGLGVGHPFGVNDQILLFPFFCRTIALPFVLRRPL